MTPLKLGANQRLDRVLYETKIRVHRGTTPLYKIILQDSKDNSVVDPTSLTSVTGTFVDEIAFSPVEYGNESLTFSVDGNEISITLTQYQTLFYPNISAERALLLTFTIDSVVYKEWVRVDVVPTFANSAYIVSGNVNYWVDPLPAQLEVTILTSGGE